MTGSVRQTVYNIVNMYIGMVILSIHYGVALGGWLSIIELLGLVWLGVYTAKILMASFKFVTRGNKMPTYANVGLLACGPWGARAVVVSTFLEFWIALLGLQPVVISLCKQHYHTARP